MKNLLDGSKSKMIKWSFIIKQSLRLFGIEMSGETACQVNCVCVQSTLEHSRDLTKHVLINLVSFTYKDLVWDSQIIKANDC